MRIDNGCPELSGPFRNEQQFKDAWIRYLRRTRRYVDIFEVENEEKVPGFPDVLCIRNDGHAEFYEMKLADKHGGFRLERTQPHFYVTHPALDVYVVVWSQGQTYIFPALRLALETQDTVSLRLNVRSLEA